MTERVGAAIEQKGGKWRMEFVEDNSKPSASKSVSDGVREMKVGRGEPRGKGSVQLEMSEGTKTPVEKEVKRIKPVIFMQDDDVEFEDLDSDDPDDDLDL